jgi:ribonuclease D
MEKRMHESRLPPPKLVTETSQLALLIAQLSRQPVVAVDTESNSLHAYQERVCLLQFSVPGYDGSCSDYLVDPLSDLDLRPLGEVLANPDVEKVFHAAEYDVMCLRRDYGWTFANLFDTMWAARVLGWPRIGLGNILQEHFGVQLNKRWQRHDWGRRPLSSEALAYARLDTHYLPSLHDRMLAELEAKGRLAEARDFFARVAQAQPNFKSFDPDADLWRVKGARDLEPRVRAVLRELLIWRDAEARRRDRPPFKIMGDQTLVALARARPDRVRQLRNVDGLKPLHLRRYGRGIIRAVAKGEQAEPPQHPARPSQPPDEVAERYEALRTWRKEVAAQRGVDPDVVVSNAALWKLARHAPRSLDQLADLSVLGPWKQQAYGKALVAVLCQLAL